MLEGTIELSTFGDLESQELLLPEMEIHNWDEYSAETTGHQLLITINPSRTVIVL